MGNEKSDQKANEGARKTHPDTLDLTIPPPFHLQGAKLSTITQAIAYHGIRLARAPRVPPREGTKANVALAKTAISTYKNAKETTETIWKQRTHRDIRKPTQQFLYRVAHNAFKVGAYWKNIPSCEGRTRCPACNHHTESLEHILVECPHPTTQLVWKMATDLWPHDAESWPDISLGLIIACGSLEVRTRNHAPASDPPNNAVLRPHQGASRLLRILIAEAAHLIWRLRCERVIGGCTHSANAIATRWHRELTDRLTTDRIITTRLRHRHADQQLMRHTWEDVLERPEPDWHTNLEVLVGIKPPRPLA
ncbi:hypothetical protein DENSPDRAFT_803901 [Dentipellis sp. KUC8613]|nr:hypothetical protein DENSPDRAFT_803901 [Dentipellis sp. KUC8613]